MRESKNFHAITEWNTVQKVEGFKCEEKNGWAKSWWVPSLGFTMTEGIHLFDTEEMAKSALKIKINQEILDLQIALSKL